MALPPPGRSAAGVPGPEPAGAAGTVDVALLEATMVGSARQRLRARGSVDRRSAVLSGGLFLVVAALWPVLSWPGPIPVAALVLAVAVHALASSVEFEIGPGSAVPTTPVLMVAALLVPPALVPGVVLAGMAVAARAAALRDPARRDTVLVLACSSWHALGPALVVAWGPEPDSRLAMVVLVAAAVAAQIGFDLAATLVRTCWGLGVPWARLRDAYRFTALVDLLLAPIGLAAALAAPGSVWGLALVVGPIALLALLQRDRRQVVDRTVVLGRAVSETADWARTDVLTGIGNRLAWEEHLALVAERPEPVGVVLLDVDGLKAANDRWGHETGDRLIRAVADIVAAHRPPDHDAVAARLGGDEFGLLLPGPLAFQAPVIAAELARAFTRAEPLDGVVPIRASVGIAVVGRGEHLPAGLARADLAVNQDKVARGARRA